MNTPTPTIDRKKYGRLLSNALPSVIKTEAENDRAILIVEKMLAKGEKLSFEEKMLLELLAQLIADFEERFYRPTTASPREVLLELMSARDLKQADLVEVFGSRSKVSEAIRHKREISKAQARALAEFFHISADVFI